LLGLVERHTLPIFFCNEFTGEWVLEFQEITVTTVRQESWLSLVDCEHNPPHPGEVLKGLCLEPLGLSVTEAANALGVSRKTLSSILHGRAGISPDMAIRLSMAFDTSAESWLNQQSM